jgi:NADPH-dependent 7-cyano-7-deazaguanine reductase QueF-like protein
MHTHIYATKLTEENLEAIVTYGAEHHLNLDDFRDDIPFYAADGWETYVIASIDMDTETLVAITTKADVDFFASWKFEDATYKMFTKVTQI